MSNDNHDFTPMDANDRARIIYAPPQTSPHVDPGFTSIENEKNLINWTKAIYILHGISILIAATTAGVAILTGFIFGWTSVLAVIFSYIKRDDVRGTWLQSHIDFQIKTFWWGFGYIVVGTLLFLTVFLIPIGYFLWFIAGIWVTYRIIKGWIKLTEHQPILDN